MTQPQQVRRDLPAQESHPQRKPWNATEQAVLREHYLAGGAAACLPALPGRTLKQIYLKANNLGLRRQKQHSIARESTDYIDAAIRRHYRQVQPRGAATALAKRLGVTRQWLSTRAATLGVVPVTRADMNWTPEEISLIEDHATKRADRISAILRGHGYHRTPSAIGTQLSIRGIDRLDPDVWTATELSRCMGVDSHVPLRWIEKGGLKAKRIGSTGDIGRTSAWEIRRKDLREFLIRSADWDHRRCPREWLVDVLAGLDN